MKTSYMLAGVICLFLTSLQPVAATSISYDVSNIGSNIWEYNYTVSNDTLGFNIDEFTVYFDFGLYENLSANPAPASWNPIVVGPGNFLNNDGYYDALALATGITPGSSLGGFSVRFNYLGAGTPGSQRFEIVDPVTFNVLDSGQTSPVPVPAAVWLFCSGLVGLIAVSKRKT
jgi:hypothetical protein